MAVEKKTTPLDPWIAAKVGCPEGIPLTRDRIASYQLACLNRVIAYAKEKSPFYGRLLAGVADPVDFGSFPDLPFTSPRDIRDQGLRMLCVSQGEIARVVTLVTSGTTGEAKRLFFTDDDLELTVDFFAHGMTTMVGAGDEVIIFLPGERPDSVGDLLARGLVKVGVTPVIHGPISDLRAAREELARHPGACLVGIPTQILSLVRNPGSDPIPRGGVGSVLLSTDYVPRAIVEELEFLLGCPVFSHYGMTETGYGAAVECSARAGYHMREADLYFEVVDPATGKPVHDGVWGEVVVSTLTRRGMPLLRYRTGDWSRILADPCPCGSVLRRMDHVRGRIGEAVPLRGGSSLTVRDLDEALFRIAGVLNYRAEVRSGPAGDELHLRFYVIKGKEEDVRAAVPGALLGSMEISAILRKDVLSPGPIAFQQEDWFTTGVGKRTITDKRDHVPPIR